MERYNVRIFKMVKSETLNYKTVSLGYETFNSYKQAYAFAKSLGSGYQAIIESV